MADSTGASVDPLDALERVHGIAVRSASADDLLAGVLAELLELFAADRACLLRPSPAGGGARIGMERTREGFELARDAESLQAAARVAGSCLETCLAAEQPVRFLRKGGSADERALDLLGIRSMLAVALRPAGEEPAVLCLQDCRGGRDWRTEGRVFRAIGIILADSLARVRAMAELRQSEDRFRTLVEHAPEAIVIFDLDAGRFTAANDVAAEFFGVSRHELTSSGGPADYSPEFQPDGQRSSEAAMRYLQAALDGAAPSFEWTHTNARGEDVPCEVRLVRLPHPQRRLIRGSIIDISARLQAEEERRELEARLAQSQKMEAIGQLAGGIAHDFNNLLTVILGGLDLLAEEWPGSEEGSGWLAQIRAAAERARSLTHRLLAFSRRQPLQPVAVDVGGLLRGMDGLLRRTLPEDIEIDLVLGGGLWRCEADEAQLQSAILNLAINARDAMPGGGRLTVEANNARLDHEYAAQHEDVRPGQYVCIAVSDNGVGVAPENLDKIFSPFFTTKPFGEGSGLGLSMVYGFVKQSGGHVKAYSEPGSGTTVRLYLPRATDRTERRERRQDDRVRRGQGQLVLLVEDDESVRGLTGRLLQSLGYRVLEAGNAGEALRILAEHEGIELLLTDVVLRGGKNGAELARAAQAEHENLLVLFMSGYTDNAIVHHGRLDPGAMLLEKPFTRRTLGLRLHEVFTAGRSR